MGQLGLGSLTTVATIAILAAATSDSGDNAGSFILLAMPAAAGLVVCGVGHTSRWYRGGCAAPIVGAYVGILSAFPLAFIGCQLAGGRSNDCFEGAVLGAVIGVLIGPAAGATVGWHLFKEPRSELGYSYGPPTSAASERERVLPRPAWVLVDDSSTGRRAHRNVGAARLTVPLLSMAF